MAEHLMNPTDLKIEAARQRTRVHDGDPRARSVKHVADLNLLIVLLTNGRRLVLPMEDVQGLSGATPKQVKDYQLLGRGTGICFPDLDVDLYVPALIEGVYGNRRWMAQLGRQGGRVKTEAKRRAAQVNGAKGGRPKKVVSAGG